MRLSDYSDYTLRVLMYCAANPDRLVTIAELTDRHQVSKNHLMKIVNDLGRQGVLATTRGRGGGLRLLKAPSAIRVGVDPSAGRRHGVCVRKPTDRPGSRRPTGQRFDALHAELSIAAP